MLIRFLIQALANALRGRFDAAGMYWRTALACLPKAPF